MEQDMRYASLQLQGIGDPILSEEEKELNRQQAELMIRLKRCDIERLRREVEKMEKEYGIKRTHLSLIKDTADEN